MALSCPRRMLGFWLVLVWLERLLDMATWVFSIRCDSCEIVLASPGSTTILLMLESVAAKALYSLVGCRPYLYMICYY